MCLIWHLLKCSFRFIYISNVFGPNYSLHGLHLTPTNLECNQIILLWFVRISQIVGPNYFNNVLSTGFPTHSVGKRVSLLSAHLIAHSLRKDFWTFACCAAPIFAAENARASRIKGGSGEERGGREMRFDDDKEDSNRNAGENRCPEIDRKRSARQERNAWYFGYIRKLAKFGYWTIYRLPMSASCGSQEVRTTFSDERATCWEWSLIFISKVTSSRSRTPF